MAEELGFETVCKLFPLLEPEPYEGDVLKHQSGKHDQKLHGSWSDGINFSGSENYGLVEIIYGDMDFARETMYGLNDVAEGGLNVWGTWEGNYQMRTVSAQMMGIERPPTEGSIYVGDARRKFLEKGDSSSLNAQAREDVQDVIFQTYAVMDSVSQSAPTELPLYRGMAVPSGSPVLGIKSGDEFTVPLSAFSYDESVARSFSEGSPSREGGKPDERMVLKLAPGAKGAAASSDYWDTQIEVNNEFVAVPNEVVSQGTFKVNKVSKTDGITFVEIEHVKYVDVGSGSFVSV